MSLSLLAIILGLGMGLPQIYGLVNPPAFGKAVRAFPRSLPWGFALMMLGTAWFLYYVFQEHNADFAAYKKYLLIGFGAVGILACVFVQDFLAVRGLAVLLLLLAKLMLDTQRWSGSEWRLVMAVWAYVLVIAGIWFTVSPWRLRDFLSWATANEKRIRLGCAFRLAFGLFVAALGFSVY